MESNSRDEIGKMAKSLNAFCEKLKRSSSRLGRHGRDFQRVTASRIWPLCSMAAVFGFCVTSTHLFQAAGCFLHRSGLFAGAL